MQALTITSENWTRGVVVQGFPVPPINKFLGGELISYDPEQGIIRVSFPTKPEHANPTGFVMGGITSAFLDHIPGPLTVAATGGTAFPVRAIQTAMLKPARA